MKEVMDQIGQFFYDYRVQFIIGIVIALIIVIMKTALRNLFKKLWELIFPPPDKIKEEDRKLKAHFEQLKKEGEDLLSLVRSLVEKDMRIVAVDTSAAELGVGYIEIRALQISDSFKAHFPGEWEEWTKWVEKAEKHNHDYEGFRQKIEKDFESKGIPVKSHLQSQANTCIFTNVFNPLFVWWGELAEGKRPWVDFQKIDSKPVEGGYLLYASGWGASAVAFAKSEDEREKCESALAEVAKDEENQGEAAKLDNSANELVEQAKVFADKFAGKLDDIHEFWPGKRTSKFRRLKKTCPDCKELF